MILILFPQCKVIYFNKAFQSAALIYEIQLGYPDFLPKYTRKKFIQRYVNFLSVLTLIFPSEIFQKIPSPFSKRQQWMQKDMDNILQDFIWTQRLLLSIWEKFLRRRFIQFWSVFCLGKVIPRRWGDGCPVAALAVCFQQAFVDRCSCSFYFLSLCSVCSLTCCKGEKMEW